MPNSSYELFEVEPGRWSYRFGDTPSGEVYPSREAAGIAAEQMGAKLDSAPLPNGVQDDLDRSSGDIEGLDRQRSLR